MYFTLQRIIDIRTDKFFYYLSVEIAKELREIGYQDYEVIKDDYSSPENSLDSFNNFLDNIHHTNPDLRLLLLIDEFEVVEALSPREKQKILNELRHLIDLTPEGLCVVLSCAPEIWRTIFSDYHAFTERFAIVSFLKPLNEEHIKKILLEYLKRNRILNTINSLKPFEENVIPLLLHLGMGNIRQTLKICQLCIDYGVKENIQRLDKNIIETTLINYDLLQKQKNVLSAE